MPAEMFSACRSRQGSGPNQLASPFWRTGLLSSLLSFSPTSCLVGTDEVMWSLFRRESEDGKCTFVSRYEPFFLRSKKSLVFCVWLVFWVFYATMSLSLFLKPQSYVLIGSSTSIGLATFRKGNNAIYCPVLSVRLDDRFPCFTGWGPVRVANRNWTQ